jgi:hypothetical protein
MKDIGKGIATVGIFGAGSWAAVSTGEVIALAFAVGATALVWIFG